MDVLGQCLAFAAILVALQSVFECVRFEMFEQRYSLAIAILFIASSLLLLFKHPVPSVLCALTGWLLTYIRQRLFDREQLSQLRKVIMNIELMRRMPVSESVQHSLDEQKDALSKRMMKLSKRLGKPLPDSISL